LADDVFPGAISLKLGFGPAELADSPTVMADWKRSLEKSRELNSYQVRVHVFQCKNIPAADSNGLCDPFLKV
jgi:hypothetical protein